MEKYELFEVGTSELEESYGQMLARLLAARGIAKEEAEHFLAPDYNAHTHDPFLLKDMDKAVPRIFEAIESDETICIYSDFDTDGIPAAVVLGDFFKKIGYDRVVTYIPHRNDEGFGLNIDAIEELAASGVNLVITLDCGIAGIEEVARANELGVDVIVTDHHLPRQTGEPPEDVLPAAVAIVDPKQKDCPYPFKDLCGAAVAYKLVQACIHQLREKDWPASRSLGEGWEKWLLDMVGIATISDMVPLVGENRVFAHYGLVVLRKSPRPGIAELLRTSFNKQKFITEEDIGFTVGPRINAASRMDTPDIAFTLLSSHNPVQARMLAEELEHLNNERKGYVASIVKAVKKKISDRVHEGPVVVVGDPEWRPSLLGLAANSIAEETRKPVFLWGRGGEKIKGSCRSDGKTHLVKLMEAVPGGIFAEFGGHAFSGGFTLTSEGVHVVREKLCEAFTALGNAAVEIEKQIIDAELALEDIDRPLFEEISRLAPFGIGNPKPLFLFKAVSPIAVSTFGKQNNHLKLLFKDSRGKNVEAISFFKTPDMFPGLKEGSSVDLVAHIEESSFNGRVLRLRIVDILTL